MALKFSEGLLSALENFGQGQQPRQQRGSGGGMLTPAARPSNPAELIAQNFGRSNIIPGLDIRTPLEKMKEEFKTIDIQDPDAMIKYYGSVLKHGDPTQKLEALAKVKEIEALKAEKAREGRYRQTLMSSAQNIGMTEEFINDIPDASAAELKEIAKLIRDRQIVVLTRGDDDAAVETLAKSAGIDPTAVKGMDFDNLSKIIDTGRQGNIKAFIIPGTEGKQARFMSTLGSKVGIRKTNPDTDEEYTEWVEASELGYEPAPQQIETKNMDLITNALSKEARESMQGTIDANLEAGQDAVQMLRLNNQSREIIDRGVFSGALAGAATDLVKMASALTGGLVDATRAGNTEMLILTRAQRVVKIIQAFGSGTGLSDSDRDFAEALALTPKLEPESLQRFLDIERQVALTQYTKYAAVLDASVESGYFRPVDVKVLHAGIGGLPEFYVSKGEQGDLEYEALRKMAKDKYGYDIPVTRPSYSPSS